MALQGLAFAVYCVCVCRQMTSVSTSAARVTTPAPLHCQTFLMSKASGLGHVQKLQEKLCSLLVLDLQGVRGATRRSQVEFGLLECTVRQRLIDCVMEVAGWMKSIINSTVVITKLTRIQDDPVHIHSESVLKGILYVTWSCMKTNPFHHFQFYIYIYRTPFGLCINLRHIPTPFFKVIKEGIIVSYSCKYSIRTACVDF